MSARQRASLVRGLKAAVAVGVASVPLVAVVPLWLLAYLTCATALGLALEKACHWYVEPDLPDDWRLWFGE